MTLPEIRAERVQERRDLEARMRKPSFNEKIERWLDLQVLEGKGWQDAAKEAGIKVRTARRIPGHPRIAQAMQERAQMMRTSEGPKNVLLATKVRDKGLADEATAATMKVALEAARYLDGDEGRGGVTVNVGLNINTPGLVVDLSKYGPPPGKTIDHEPDGQA